MSSTTLNGNAPLVASEIGAFDIPLNTQRFKPTGGIRWRSHADIMEGQTLVLSGCYFSCRRGGTRSPAVAKILRRQVWLSGEGHQHPGLLNRSDGRRKSDRCRQ